MDKIVLFGRGLYCRRKYKDICQRYEVVAFIDNAVVDREYDSSYDKDVYNPSDLKKLEYDYVMCASIQFVDMWEQLKGLGVQDNKVKFIVQEVPLCKDSIEETAFSKGEYLCVKNGDIYYYSNSNKEYKIENIDVFRAIVRKEYRYDNSDISQIAALGLQPVTRTFGLNRGHAVDRYYIEKFLERYSEDVKGTVMEIDSNLYTRRYGKEKVTKEVRLHVEGWNGAIKGNFETGEGLSEEMVDCLICTQTLQYIYDLESAIKNIKKILKPGGVALITVPGIKSLSINDDTNWGEHWSFTKRSMTNICEKAFGKEDYSVETYGNAKIVCAYMYGLCQEDLTEDDFIYNDKQFPFIVTARVVKH